MDKEKIWAKVTISQAGKPDIEWGLKAGELFAIANMHDGKVESASLFRAGSDSLEVSEFSMDRSRRPLTTFSNCGLARETQVGEVNRIGIITGDFNNVREKLGFGSRADVSIKRVRE